MKKNVIYVDFIFTKRKINFFNFYFLTLLSSLKKHLSTLLSAKTNHSSIDNKIKKVQ